MRKPILWVTPIFVLALGLAGSDSAYAQVSISENQCTADSLGTSIPVSSIGEPVSAVTLSPPVWTPAAGNVPAHCSIDGVMSPANPEPSARPINFRVALPALWNRRSAQLGGGGLNGFVPNLAGAQLRDGYAAYGSDSGHQASFPPGGGRAVVEVAAIRAHHRRTTGRSTMRPSGTWATCR